MYCAARFYAIKIILPKIFLITWNIHCRSARVTIADERPAIGKTFPKWKLTEIHEINFFFSLLHYTCGIRNRRQKVDKIMKILKTHTHTPRKGGKEKSSILLSYSFVIIFCSLTENGEFHSHFFSTLHGKLIWCASIWMRINNFAYA